MNVNTLSEITAFVNAYEISIYFVINKCIKDVLGSPFYNWNISLESDQYFMKVVGNGYVGS